jgi:hypothetical protein
MASFVTPVGDDATAAGNRLNLFAHPAGSAAAVSSALDRSIRGTMIIRITGALADRPVILLLAR